VLAHANASEIDQFRQYIVATGARFPVVVRSRRFVCSACPVRLPSNRAGARIRVPNVAVHAAMHAIVETLIALGDEAPARRTAQRLMDEGLDRHEAIHAIGSVLVEFMTDLIKAPKSDGDPNVAYFAALERLTAANWLSAR
jgi:hypothetical protein